MPTPSSLTCANCGQPLPHADAVCTRCEPSLRGTPLPGLHRCPACQGSFAHPEMHPWPPEARWYQPQRMRPHCPHCHSLLLDRIASFYRFDPVILIAMLLAILLLPFNEGNFWIGLLLGMGLAALRARRAALRLGRRRYARATIKAVAEAALAFSRNAANALWMCVAWLLLPLVWGFCTTRPYFLPNARGLTVPATTVPVLAVVLAWALLLSFPRLRCRLLFRCAGACLMALGLMLSWFSVFAHTCGFVLLTVGLGLAINAPKLPPPPAQGL